MVQAIHSTRVISDRGAMHTSHSTRGFRTRYGGVIVACWLSIRFILVVFIKSLLLLVPLNCLFYLAQQGGVVGVEKQLSSWLSWTSWILSVSCSTSERQVDFTWVAYPTSVPFLTRMVFAVRLEPGSSALKLNALTCVAPTVEISYLCRNSSEGVISRVA